VLLVLWFATPAVATEHVIEPPKAIRITEQPDEEQTKALPVLKQSAALADSLAGLSRGSLNERVARLKKKVLADLVYVEGGSFMMGDFWRC
jgi:hypothetical protein